MISLDFPWKSSPRKIDGFVPLKYFLELLSLLLCCPGCSKALEIGNKLQPRCCFNAFFDELA